MGSQFSHSRGAPSSYLVSGGSETSLPAFSGQPGQTAWGHSLPQMSRHSGSLCWGLSPALPLMLAPKSLNPEPQVSWGRKGIVMVLPSRDNFTCYLNCSAHGLGQS